MSVPQGCEDAVERLWSYVAGDASATDEALVEAHLAHCLRCCGEVAFARELQARLAAATPRMPVGTEERLSQLAEALEPDPGRT